MQSSSKGKQKNSKYKALILDVDGTIMPNKRDAMPNPKITEMITKANKIMHVCLATSRPYNASSHIFEHLKLSDYCIVNGGAQIVDMKTKKFVWEQAIEKTDAKAVCDILQNLMHVPFWLNNGYKDTFIPPDTMPKQVFQIYITGKLTNAIADSHIKKISHIANIASHKVPSWDEGYYDILISHALATKQYGIFEIAKLLHIPTHAIIGVGDGYNDFPLLMACGLKVAMGNADPELKTIADYIAPPVEKDGVADVINKFIL